MLLACLADKNGDQVLWIGRLAARPVGEALGPVVQDEARPLFGRQDLGTIDLPQPAA
jgi:hypothetical protein